MTQTTQPPIHVLFVKGEPAAVSTKPFDLPQYGDPSALHQVQYPQSVSELEKQRDELLAALKWLEKDYGDEFDDGESLSMDAARAAIAKAEVA